MLAEFANHEELFLACAAEPILYCQTFFPRTVRQGTPEFHVDFWTKLEDDAYDFFGAEVFRGGAKTTLCRLALSRRIAYAVSRNILSVGVSEGMAIHTSRWLKKQVQFNTLWAQTYKLTPGDKWTDEFFEVKHGIEGCTIAVTSKGMTSGLRGLNLDDYRPDLIYCDDICNEENTSTEAGRKKTDELIFGALVPSLAPKSESPKRKFVLTNTAITKEDPIVKAHDDPTFLTVKYPKIIEDEETGEMRSAWPARWTLEECLAEKEAYISKRRLYIWLREYGCKIVGAGEAAFDIKWVKEWQVLPMDLEVYIGIDPARSKKTRAHKSSIVVVGISRSTGDTYLLETWAQKGQNPEQIWVQLLSYYLKWRPKRVGVESVAYQQMLAWYIRQKQQETGIYFFVSEFDDRRSKADRITQAYTGISSAGKFHAHPNHTEFLAAFEEYTLDMDIDILDAGAIAICEANPWMYQGGVTLDPATGKPIDPIALEEQNIPDLELELGAP
jgi:hypothetical protein